MTAVRLCSRLVALALILLVTRAASAQDCACQASTSFLAANGSNCFELSSAQSLPDTDGECPSPCPNPHRCRANKSYKWTLRASPPACCEGAYITFAITFVDPTGGTSLVTSNGNVLEIVDPEIVCGSSLSVSAWAIEPQCLPQATLICSFSFACANC